ncbi:MAG: DUF1761 domain-containing protein [Sphingomonadaceae bacterium]
MGPVNWLAVVVAAAAAALVLWLFWRGRSGWHYLLQLVPAAMLGHALARIGPEKLAIKPHLYLMQSGGLALAIAIPALWMAGLHGAAKAAELRRDSAAFLAAYLAMGAVFWALA